MYVSLDMIMVVTQCNGRIRMVAGSSSKTLLLLIENVVSNPQVSKRNIIALQSLAHLKIQKMFVQQEDIYQFRFRLYIEKLS